MVIYFFCILCHFFCTSIGNCGSITWWVNAGESNETDVANVAAIKQHSTLFNQLQINWPGGCSSDGNLSNWFSQEERINQWLSLYQPLNIPIVPAVVCINNRTTMHNNLYPSSQAQQFANTLVSIAQKYNFSGFTFDYEPQQPVDDANNASLLYEEFLNIVNGILTQHGLMLTVWVADWSNALNHYGTLAKSDINALQDMTTYPSTPGIPFDVELGLMEQFLDEINSGVGSIGQACVGLGCYRTKFWDSRKLDKLIDKYIESGGTKLCIFRLLMDGTNNWPPDYWYDSLEMFVNNSQT